MTGTCEVCGGPNASGYHRCPDCPRRGKWEDAPCARCGRTVGWIDSGSTGGWWAHKIHPLDGHDALPVVYTRTEPYCPCGAPSGNECQGCDI